MPHKSTTERSPRLIQAFELVESVLFGTTADAEATGDGGIIALLKRLRTLAGEIKTLATEIKTFLGAGLPTTLSSTGNFKIAVQEVPTGGTHGNLWNNVTPSAGGFSTSSSFSYANVVTVFGSVAGATTLTIQMAVDNTNFYDAATIVMSGAGHFYWSQQSAASRVRLKSSNAVAITATAATKG